MTAMAKEISDMHKKRRGRNIALVVIVFALAALFYVMSIGKCWLVVSAGHCQSMSVEMTMNAG